MKQGLYLGKRLPMPYIRGLWRTRIQDFTSNIFTNQAKAIYTGLHWVDRAQESPVRRILDSIRCATIFED